MLRKQKLRRGRGLRAMATAMIASRLSPQEAQIAMAVLQTKKKSDPETDSISSRQKKDQEATNPSDPILTALRELTPEDVTKLPVALAKSLLAKYSPQP